MSDAAGVGLFFMAVGFVTGTALVALSVFALSRRPRVPGPFWFGLFALGYGGGIATVISMVYFHADLDWIWLSRTPFAFLLAVAVAVMPFVFPSPLRRSERHLGFMAVVLVAGLLFIQLLALAERDFFRTTRMIYSYAEAGVTPAWIGGLILFALRYAHAGDDAERRKLALASAAFSLPVAFSGGYLFVEYAGIPIGIATLEERYALRDAAVVAALVLVAAVWLSATRGPGGRLARNMAWFTLAILLVGALASQHAITGSWESVRFLTVLVLIYAVFKHQLLGIDTKLRFALSKSTIAAVFIAVFFIASETAQQFFGETLGSTYIGIAAAGALVFAMAPLQRVAERLAEKAVPLPAQVGAAAPTRFDESPHADAGRVDAYRRAVRHALRDREITREEERHLADLATYLGVDYRTALAVREGIEDEGAEPAALSRDGGA